MAKKLTVGGGPGATIKEKADHVRSKLRVKKFRTHHCHWPGCEEQVHPARWGCLPHWYALPLSLRTRLWHAYAPGQEQTRRPSRQYVEVAREIQTWIHEQARAKSAERTGRRKAIAKKAKGR